MGKMIEIYYPKHRRITTGNPTRREFGVCCKADVKHGPCGTAVSYPAPVTGTVEDISDYQVLLNNNGMMKMSKELKRILIVEDEQDLIESFKLRFEKAGFDVMTASDGQEGLKMAKEGKPSLVILDLMLPKLDGLKVCRMIKFDNRFSSIPVIILTARAEEKDRRLSLDMGADAYLTKPFKWDELHAKIKELLKIK